MYYIREYKAKAAVRDVAVGGDDDIAETNLPDVVSRFSDGSYSKSIDSSRSQEHIKSLLNTSDQHQSYMNDHETFRNSILQSKINNPQKYVTNFSASSNDSNNDKITYHKEVVKQSYLNRRDKNYNFSNKYTSKLENSYESVSPNNISLDNSKTTKSFSYTPEMNSPVKSINMPKWSNNIKKKLAGFGKPLGMSRYSKRTNDYYVHRIAPTPQLDQVKKTVRRFQNL